MPVIVCASSKGGVGKTTTSLLLATELAHQGAEVTLIDADENRPLSRWSKRDGKPKNITVLDSVTEETIIEEIENAARKTAFVIVDLEGTASMIVGFAMSRADLVIIPTQGSEVDGVEAIKAVKLIRSQERAFGRTIPFAVLFTRVSAAIPTRTLKSIQADFREAGVPMFRTQLVERAAYRELFMFGGDLYHLDSSQVSNVPPAIENAHALAVEVISMFQTESAA